jgi:cephalosporin-C deacetylase-like acetyl esterase
MMRAFLVMMAFLAGSLAALEYTVDFSLNHADGVYKAGEPIRFSAQLLEDGKPATGKQLRCILSHDASQVETVDRAADTPVIIETAMDRPGWCRLLVIGLDKDHKTLAYEVNGRQRHAVFNIGVVVDPLAVKPGVPAPEDFTAFWDEQKAKLKRIPMRASLRPIPDTPPHRKANFVRLDCGDGFRPVNGILHVPATAKPKSLPILLHVHGAGVHSPLKKWQWAPPAKGKAKGPNIFFNLDAHGLPDDQPPSFYTNLREGELKNYPFIKSADREHYYMKGMILRLIRTLEFLKTLPEWNGRDIVVSGGSQGGAQALFAAGADPQVSEIYADVPAMCDLGGDLAERLAGWPKLYYRKAGTIMINQDYNPKHAVAGDEQMIRTAGYFDAANFAKNITCKVYMRTGGTDGVCPPTSVFAAYNNIPSQDKVIEFSPLGGHCRGIYHDTETIKLASFRNGEKQ